MNTSHTPAPWSFQKNNNGSLDFFGEDGKRVIINNVHLMNRDANAHLIAAAPDMLDALNVALMCMIGYTHRNEVIDNAIEKINESINKATGQPIPI